MKEINKLFLIIICLLLNSCKVDSLVNFESENYESFKDNPNSECMPDEFYFTRIMTAIEVDIIFKRFSMNCDFNDITVENIILKDDSDNVIYQKEVVKLKSDKFEEKIGNIQYEIYTYAISTEELDRNFLSNYKTKFIILNYEIDGKKYSEKLRRDEKKMLILPT